MSVPRASSVSRQIKAAWDGVTDFPIVEQVGTHVLIEGDWDSLGLAADILARRAEYRLVHSGQWVVDGFGEMVWLGWVEVFR